MASYEIVVYIGANLIEFSVWLCEGGKVLPSTPGDPAYEHRAGASRRCLREVCYYATSLPDRLQKWRQLIEVIGDANSPGGAKLAQRILLDEIEADTWRPGVPSWLEEVAPLVFTWLMAPHVEKRVQRDWDETRDAWMAERFGDTYWRALAAEMQAREKLIIAIMER